MSKETEKLPNLLPQPEDTVFKQYEDLRDEAILLLSQIQLNMESESWSEVKPFYRALFVAVMTGRKRKEDYRDFSDETVKNFFRTLLPMLKNHLSQPLRVRRDPKTKKAIQAIESSAHIGPYMFFVLMKVFGLEGNKVKNLEEIAEELNVSMSTVSTYLHNTYKVIRQECPSLKSFIY